MNKELAVYIGRTSDEVLYDYLENYLIIFANSSGKIKEFYKSIATKKQRWTKKRYVNFPYILL